MQKLSLTSAWLLLAILGASCTTGDSVGGVAEFEHDDMLPSSAHLEASLQDVSLQDVAAELISEVRIAGPLQSPLVFEIPFEKSEIEEGRTYSVRASIYDGEVLLLTTDTMYSVLSEYTETIAHLMLVPVGEFKLSVIALIPTRLPATFEGLLPCADCPGINTRLTLNANGSFVLRSEYIDRELTGNEDEYGRWSYDESSQKITLSAGTQRLRYYHLADPESVRMLNSDGDNIDSTLNYALRRIGK